MAAIDVEKLLAQTLPKTLKAANGDSIIVEWHSALEHYKGASQSGNKRPDLPFATFQLLTPVRVDPNHIDRFLKPKTKQAIENKTFTTGTLIYEVSEEDIDSIVSITGTAAGSPRTFVLDTDFEVISNDDYITKNAIQWKTGGTLPDNSTSFTITYNHNVFDRMINTHWRYIYRLVLFVGDLKNTERGATKYYPKSYLAQQLGEDLSNQLMDMQNKNLSGTGDVVVGAIQNLGMLPPDEEESLVRWVFDLVIMRNLNAVLAEEVTIGKVSKTTSPSV